MRCCRCVLAGLLAMVLLARGGLCADEVLINEDVVDLIASGMDTKLVKRKIEKSDNDFDVSAKAMVELRRQGVPDDIIKEMLARAEKVKRRRESRLNLQIQSLTSPQPASRQAAYMTLLRMGRRAKTRLLEVLTSAKNKELRVAAADALGRLGAKESVPSLQVLLGGTESVLRLAAAEALANLDEKNSGRLALKHLEQWVDAEEREKVDGYLRLIGLIGEKQATKIAAIVLEESADPVEREEAARALGRLKAQAHLEGLENVLQHDRSASTRAAAARALARIASPGSVDALIVAIRKDRANRVSLIYALSRFEAKKVVPVFISLLDRKLDEREANALTAGLRRLTHQDFGLQQAKWLQWWEEQDIAKTEEEE